MSHFLEMSIYTWFGKTTIVLEAVASYDLWIWHAFFGPPGTLNDINVLDRSSVFDDIIQGHAPQVTFSVNGRDYHMAYYLTDGIYHGQLLSNQFQYHKVRKRFYLLNTKKLSEKMSSVLLESCKLALPLSKIQHFFGIKSKLERL